MKQRATHVVLILLAMPPGAIGAYVLLRGVFDPGYDSTIWTYLIFGLPLLGVAAMLVTFVLADVRRSERRA